MSDLASEPFQLKAEIPPPTPPPKGRVVTFYSYKGGTGRSMALANVAWMLALSGERVLVVDWDLEAPGLHQYFHPFLKDKDLTETKGLIDFVSDLAAVFAKPWDSHEAAHAAARQKAMLVDQYITRLHWPANTLGLNWERFGERARISFLPAGRQGPGYGYQVNTFPWADFYTRSNGGGLLKIAREQWKLTYDYVLIDSRTGVSDTSGICTVEMPETLVICFTLNRQSLTGARAIAESVRKKSSEREGVVNPIRILPVAARVEVNEHEKSRIGMELAQKAFTEFLTGSERESSEKYWGAVQMVHIPYYAFEEIPAVFGDNPHQVQSLRTALRHLTAAITTGEFTDVPPLAEKEADAERARQEILNWYLRRPEEPVADEVRAAQEIFEQLDHAQRESFLSDMSRLVEVGSGDVLIPKSTPWVDLRAVGAGFNSFIRAGLVFASEGTVAFRTPVLVEKWKPLREWVGANRDFLLFRQKLNALLAGWKVTGLDEKYLLSDKLLDQAQRALASRPLDLNSAEAEFIGKSSEYARRKAEKSAASRRMVRRVSLMAGLGAVLVAGYLYFSTEQKRSEIATATANRIADSLTKTDPMTAVLLFLEVKDRPEARFLYNQARQIAKENTFPSVLLRQDFKFASLDFSPDGKHLLALDTTGAAKVVNAQNWATEAAFPAGDIAAAAFGGWGKQADSYAYLGITVHRNYSVRVWNITPGNPAANDRIKELPVPIQAKNLTLQSCAGPNATLLARRTNAANLGLTYPIEARLSPDGKFALVRYDSLLPTQFGLLVPPPLATPGLGIPARGNIAIFRLNDGKCEDTYADTDRAYAAFNQNGAFVATLSGQATTTANFYPQAELFRVDGRQRINLQNIGPASTIYADCEAGRVALDSVGNGITVVDRRSSPPKQLPTSPDFTIPWAISCDGGRLAEAPSLMGLNGASVLVQSLDPPQQDRNLSFPPLSGGLHPVAFRPSAPQSPQLLVAASDGALWSWDLNRPPLDEQKVPPTNTQSKEAWDNLMNYFAATAKGCLTVDDRRKYLDEKLSDAIPKSEQCLQSRFGAN